MTQGVLALAVAALMTAGATTPADVPAPAASPAPRIVLQPASFEFGTVRAGKAVEKEFLIHNHGRTDLVIESVVSSCGCTAALTDSKTVKPGGSTPLRVTLTAPEEPGRLQKSVLIKSNDPAHPTVELKIEATIAAEELGGRRPRAGQVPRRAMRRREAAARCEGGFRGGREHPPGRV